MLNTLPQVFQNSATDFSNTSNSLSTPGGITTVNLRGLAPQRTLVLVNGRRLGTGDPNTGNPNPAANIDQIPVALVERVDVVTGGASAVYGSDAIAGVVNFILKDDLEGVEVDAQYGFNYYDNGNGLVQGLANDAGIDVAGGSGTDGANLSVSVIGGTNIADDRGNFTAYFTYRQADPITGSDRDFSGCQVFTVLPDSSRCGGTSNSNYFRLVTSQDEYSVVGDQFLPRPQAGSSPPAEFNSNEFINMSRDSHALHGGVHGARVAQRLRRAVRGVRLHEQPDRGRDRAVRSFPQFEPVESGQQLRGQLQQSAALGPAARDPLHARADRGGHAEPGVEQRQRRDRPPKHRGRRTRRRVRAHELPRRARGARQPRAGVELRRIRAVLLHDAI